MDVVSAGLTAALPMPGVESPGTGATGPGDPEDAGAFERELDAAAGSGASEPVAVDSGPPTTVGEILTEIDVAPLEPARGVVPEVPGDGEVPSDDTPEVAAEVAAELAAIGVVELPAAVAIESGAEIDGSGEDRPGPTGVTGAELIADEPAAPSSREKGEAEANEPVDPDAPFGDAGKKAAPGASKDEESVHETAVREAAEPARIEGVAAAPARGDAVPSGFGEPVAVREAPAPSTLPADASPRLTYEAVAAPVRVLAREGGGEARIHLAPAELGRVDVVVVVEDGHVRASIVPERPEVGDLMLKHVPELVQRLGELGLAIEDVTVETGGFRDGRPDPERDGSGGPAGEPSVDEVLPRSTENQVYIGPDGVNVLA